MFYLLVCCIFSISHICNTIQYLSFSVQFISLSIMPQSSSVLLQMAEFHSFLWLSIICIHLGVCVCVCVHV